MAAELDSFSTLCSLQLAAYGTQWLELSAAGYETDALLSQIEDLALGLEVLYTCYPLQSSFTASLVAGLTSRHQLMCTPLSPFHAVPFCVQVTPSGNNSTHNLLVGLQKVGTGSGYYHLDEVLANKILAFFNPVLGLPTEPISFTTSPITGGGISVAFQPPTSDGGSAILKYQLVRNSVLLTELTGLAFIDNTAVAGVAYTYSVRAVNSVGEGPFAVAEPVYVGTSTVPSVPLNMSANQVGTTAALTVVASTPASNGGSPITSYNLYRNGSNTPLTTGLTGLSYTDSTITYGVSYTYQYSALNAVGEGPKAAASNPVTATAPLTTYSGTYTTTAQDALTKCQTDTPVAAVTRTSTSTISQSDADSKAMAAAIMAITCPVTTTYNGSYTTTPADYTAKCGSGTGSAITRTATSTVSQAAADSLAHDAAINAIVCSVPATYDTTLTGNPQTAGAMSFVPGANEQLKFNLITSFSGPTISIAITSLGSTSYIDYASEHSGAGYTFINSAGSSFNGTFPASDNLNITY